jgi:hypothetical protein
MKSPAVSGQLPEQLPEQLPVKSLIEWLREVMVSHHCVAADAPPAQGDKGNL